MDETERPLVESVLNAGAQRRDELVEMLRCKGSLKYARSRAKEFIAKATHALGGVADGDGKGALIETAKFLASRTV